MAGFAAGPATTCAHAACHSWQLQRRLLSVHSIARSKRPPVCCPMQQHLRDPAPIPAADSLLITFSISDPCCAGASVFLASSAARSPAHTRPSSLSPPSCSRLSCKGLALACLQAAQGNWELQRAREQRAAGSVACGGGSCSERSDSTGPAACSAQARSREPREGSPAPGSDSDSGKLARSCCPGAPARDGRRCLPPNACHQRPSRCAAS